MLSDLYLTSQSTISRIVQKTVNFIYLCLGMLPIWPSVQYVKKNLQDLFKELYPDTFMIIDATEIRCEVTSSLPLQSQLCSSYKEHNALKSLVGMTLMAP